MRKIHQTLLFGFAAAAMAAASVIQANDKAPAEKPDKVDKPIVTRDLLSKHETIAIFKGTEFYRCMALTSRCPEKCGHSGLFANFEITEYTKYEKPGEYGDAKQKRYSVQVSDFYKKPIGDPKIVAFIKSLKVGDEVVLHWNHNYVTWSTGELTSKSPERVITKLEKKGEAKKVEKKPVPPVPAQKKICPPCEVQEYLRPRPLPMLVPYNAQQLRAR